MFATTFGSTVQGVDAKTISIEVNVLQGGGIWMSGLPDTAINRECSSDRISHKNSRVLRSKEQSYNQPGPADIRKEGFPLIFQ